MRRRGRRRAPKSWTWRGGRRNGKGKREGQRGVGRAAWAELETIPTEQWWHPRDTVVCRRRCERVIQIE